jgi:hypothetical protein
MLLAGSPALAFPLRPFIMFAFFHQSSSLPSWITAQFERTRLVTFAKPGRVVTCLDGGATAGRVKGREGGKKGEGERGRGRKRVREEGKWMDTSQK